MMQTLSGAFAGARHRGGFRWFTQALVLVGVVALLAGYTPAFANHPSGTPTDVAPDRFAGDNRFDTAGIIADDAFGGSASEVLLARADLYPDALSGNYLAGVRGIPILLMPHDFLSAHTMEWLDSLGTDDITILGGTAAISAANEQRLEGQGFDVDRIAGETRFETAQLTAEQGAAEGAVGTWEGERTAIVASGENFPDALVSGALGFSESFPVLLTNTAFLTDYTRQALDNLDIERVIIPGGSAAVSPTTESQIRFMGIEVTRVAGRTRVTTATEFADFVQDEFQWGYETTNLARGDLFPDALTVGPHAGSAEAPLLLTYDPNTLGGSTLANGEQETGPWLREHACEILALHFAGGTQALTTSTAQQAAQAAEACDDSVGQITLTPSIDSNQVGANHTVTASVEQADGDPAGNVQVRFEVTRDGSPTGEPSNGSDTTDAQGDATFTYSNDTAGTDTITACTNFDGSLPGDCDEADVRDTAFKGWQAAPDEEPVVTSMTLSPSTDGNTVGDPHTVTAHVEDQDDDPFAGAEILFEVTRDGSPTGDPPDGTGTSDAQGDATFTYTNDTTGTDTITACTNEDGSLPSSCADADEIATASKTWSTGQAGSLTLEPFSASNPVGTSHEVTATVEDGTGNPSQGVIVHFEVDGTTQQEATATTDAEGRASFTYSSDTEGQDTIVACANTDGSEPADCDSNTGPQDEAIKDWEPRVASRIDLEPQDDSNPAGTQHQVTATVYDQVGDPFPGATVRFEVTGTVETSGNGSSPSGDGGQVTFTYGNDGSLGQDAITACTDADGGDPGTCGQADVTDLASKTWEAAGPAELFLGRDEATNTVGEQHKVTATVEDEFDNPVPGAVVRFEIDGAFQTTTMTDADGQATFTYSTNSPGDDTITACTTEDGSEPADCPTTEALTASQTKHWLVGDSAELDLEDEEDSNTVGDDHTVTASVIDEFGNPVPNVDVRFEIRGEATETVRTTNADGEATFTYTGPKTPTEHTIDACTDIGGNAPADCPQEDPADDKDGDLQDAVLKTWDPGPLDEILLDPLDDTNVTGENHEVTATAVDEFGNGLAGVAVRFEVTDQDTGLPEATASPNVDTGTTGSDGHVRFSYTNSLAGVDVITVCTNPDETEPPLLCAEPETMQAETTQTWTDDGL